jgi:hypothetical protein
MHSNVDMHPHSAMALGCNGKKSPECALFEFRKPSLRLSVISSKVHRLIQQRIMGLVTAQLSTSTQECDKHVMSIKALDPSAYV